jgi:acylphosphatase
MKRVKILVHGQVQGVFYRYFTKRMANKLDVQGWCRNEPGGIVLIIAEGKDSDISKLIDWCHEGSPLSKVKKVEVKEEKYTGQEGGFEAR